MLYLTSTTPYPRRRLFIIAILALLAAIVSFFLFDQKLAQFFNTPEMLPVWQRARDITNVGLSIHYFIASAVIYCLTKWWWKEYADVRAWARDFFVALVSAGLFVNIVKMMVGRQRPHISPLFEAHVFHPFTLNWDFQSMPSGHSQVMFTVATMLAFGFPKGRWAFFLIAAFFAFTRVVTRDHFFSDVIMGSAVGHIITVSAIYFLHGWLKKRSQKRTAAH